MPRYRVLEVAPGVEPDPRVGRWPVHLSSTVALFPVDFPGTHWDGLDGLRVAAGCADIAAVVAATDGPVTEAARAVIVRWTQAIVEDAATARFAGYLRWLCHQTPKRADALKRTRDLDRLDSRSVLSMLVSVAYADGALTPARVAMMSTIGGRLGASNTEIARLLHEGPQPMGSLLRETAEPCADTGGHRSFRRATLDWEVVQRVQADTAAADQLLRAFLDEADESSLLERPESPGSQLTGVDDRDQQLVHRIRTRDRWQRADLESEARLVGIALLDGALDRINEAALDACGEPLTFLDRIDNVELLRVDPIAAKAFS